MRQLGFRWLGAFLFLTSSLCASAAPEVRVVTDLERTQPYAPLLFHAHYLWVASSTTGTEKTVYDVSLYNSEGHGPMAQVRIPHSAEHLYAFGSQAAVVVGKSSWPWKTHYTILSLTGRGLSAETTTFPEEIQTEQFGGQPGAMFFNEVGSRSVFRWDGKGSQPLKAEISGPGQMLLTGGFLYVLERNGFALGDENITRIKLSDESSERVFTDGLRNGLTNMLVLNDSSYLAASESLANQVLLIDRKSNKLAGAIAIPGGTPRPLDQFGHCLVVGSDISKKVTFVDMKQTPAKVVAEWDLAVAGPKFENLYSLAVDPDSGRVFGRSKDVCGSCTLSRNSIVVAQESTGEVRRACGIN